MLAIFYLAGWGEGFLKALFQPEAQVGPRPDILAVAFIGYARVLAAEENLALQRDALRAAAREGLFEDQASGAKADRPGLARALGHIRVGETLVVWKLDRFGRSMTHLIETVRGLEKRGAGLPSLTVSIPAELSPKVSTKNSPVSAMLKRW